MPLNEKNGFEQAINVISTRIRLILYQLPENTIKTIQEIRLRTNKPVVIVTDTGSSFLTEKGKLTRLFSDLCITVSNQEFNDTVNRICNYSIHSYQQSINNGFITINGGHRVGICGTASFSDRNNYNVKDINSVNIRIARQVFGVSEAVTEKCFGNGLQSIIIAGPPSSGKTTFLKDLSFRLSSGFTGSFHKTAVIDERGELSASHSGIPQNDLGLNTDILINYKKQTAVEIALRSLSPEFIVFDEIVSFDELEQIKSGLNSGVYFAVSVHCSDESDFKDKTLLREMIKTQFFKYIVLLSSRPKPCTLKKIYRLNYSENEISWSDIYSD